MTYIANERTAHSALPDPLRENIHRAVSVPTPPSKSESLDDWSYVTKDLIDSMPRVWTRGLLYLLLIFSGVILPWTLFSQVEETGSARGRLEPQGQTLSLDAAVAGAISAIQVKEGEQVAAGQQIMILNSELLEVELRQAKDQLSGHQNRLNQLQLLKGQLTTTLTTQQQHNQAQSLEKKTQIDQAARQLDHAKKEADLAAIALASAERELARFSTLYQQGIIAEVEMIEHQDILLEQQQRHEQSQADIVQSTLQLQERKQNYESLLYTGKLSLLQVEEELNTLDTQIAQLAAEHQQNEGQIQALQLQLEQRIITAPIAGTIFELPYHQAGAVVQPNSKIVEIAPENATFVVNADIATAESGSLREGLPVKLKFDAYPFQDYGIATGKLAKVSPTSRVEETQQGAIAIYQLEIELDRPCLPAPQGCIPLRPGESVSAEVIVRKRRVISLILEPFKKLKADGLSL